MAEQSQISISQAANESEILELIEAGHIPEIYFNGFSISLGTGDILLVLNRNNKPVAALQASYTLAKTLAKSLTEIIEELERRTGNDIMTTHHVARRLLEGAGHDTD
jgi:hypothetical protein